MRGKFLFFTAVMCLLFSQVSFAASYETEVVNHAGIGDISISLEEFELDESGQEIPYRDFKTVLPGQRVSKIVRITNRADPAWIRAKAEFGPPDGIWGLSGEGLVLGGGDWVRIGAYYYLKSPLEKGKSVDFIREVKIPADWDESLSGQSFSILASADAVQAANFTPDFSDGDPWFGTLIEACVHEEYEGEEGKKSDFSVSFEGGAEGMVRTGEDFFSGWGTLMPGDTVSDRVELKNRYSRPVTIFFRTETVAEDALLKALLLEIKSGDRTVFSGTMDFAQEEAVPLADLEPGGGAELSYTLHVPRELNNPYALSKTKTKWIFSVQVKNSSISRERIVCREAGEAGAVPVKMEKEASLPLLREVVRQLPETVREIPGILGEIPETGDERKEPLLFFLMAVSGAGIVLLNRKKGGGL